MRLSIFSPPTSTTRYPHHHHHHDDDGRRHQHDSSFFSPFLYPNRRRHSRWLKTLMASTTPTTTIPTKKDKLVVIMGATGTGKSRLSVDLATRFFPSEIINSDKMQVYKGLDITTNKIPLHERRNIPHHFLGEFVPEDDDDVEFTPDDFRLQADRTITDIISRKRTPLLVGGSNSFIYSLLVEDYNPELNVFDGFDPDSVSLDLRYNCCFLWVDSSLQVLFDYLNKRVDEMFDSGMFEELAEFFNSEKMRNNNTSSSSLSRRTRVGLTKAIGVPEFERYFKMNPPPPPTPTWKKVKGEWDRVRGEVVYQEAVREIKENTCELAKRQIGKILKLRGAGWDLQRLDATTAFRMLMNGEEEWRRVWERQVLEPSVKIVMRFLDE